MILGCACGGVLELLVVAVAGGGTLLAAVTMRFRNLFRRGS